MCVYVSEMELSGSAADSEERALCSLEGPEGVFGFGDDLELNQFDGLPFSSRYYRLLRERQSLPVWNIRGDFFNALERKQLTLISGTTKTGKSTQARFTASCLKLYLFIYD